MKLPIGDVCPGLHFLWNHEVVQFQDWWGGFTQGCRQICVGRPEGGVLVIDVIIEGEEVDFGEKATPLLV